MDAYDIIQAAAPFVSGEDHQPKRRSSNYHPTLWGEHFLEYASDDTSFSEEAQEHERLKEEVRKKLIETPDRSRQKLDLIDNIQRLGVAYHFETEIEASFRSIYEVYDDDQFKKEDGNDLHTISLRFRLLRQHGYYVSSDVFDKFKDGEGNFEESLKSDVQGLLSLYEAANYRVHDEDILEEALNFTTSKLESILPNLNNFQKAQVSRALDMPIQKALIRMQARQYMSLYQEDESHDAILLTFAKYDFKILQKQHREELRVITKWWKGLDSPKNTPFARDRLVEGFLWIMGVYFEPKYSFARTMMTKVVALTCILDDIYDVHGTLDELVLLTDSIERWDKNELDQLPSYMRPCYQALLDAYSEMEKGLSMERERNPVDYAISSMKALMRAYLEEAKWGHSGYLPEFEEYMELALVTSTYPMLATNALVSMGDVVSEDALAWVSNNPFILRASSTISRLLNDIVSYEDEKEKGELVSAVECYTQQYGVSKEETIVEFERRIENEWKDINKAMLLGSASGIPMFIQERILNLTKVAHLFYKHEDGYTHGFTVAKDFITLLFVDPIQI